MFKITVYLGVSAMNNFQKITIIGASGFLGSQINASLNADGFNVFCPLRPDLVSLTGHLGIVVYAAGFGRCSSLEEISAVVDANINVLGRILRECSFSKLIYISSTRVYMGSVSSTELSDVGISSSDQRKAFNLSKLLAEELCLSIDNTYLIRPSNIYGLATDSSLFLPSIVRDAIVRKSIDMYVPKLYEKDYVSVLDVVQVIKKIIIKSRPDHRVYNVGSGENTVALEIANRIQSKLDCTVIWRENDVSDIFPLTDISRIKSEFAFSPSKVMLDLDIMIDDFISAHRNGNF